MPKNRIDTDTYLAGIRAGDWVMLSKAITLVESTRADDQQQAEALLAACLPYAGQSYRVGITGVPGAGKSTFIDVLGKKLIDSGHRVAVLSVDPTSTLTGGSILGDKTRMEQLSQSPKAFIRPSPASGALGGVARHTHEAMILCEAAGYQWILIETVGVGQSEIEVRNLVDIFLLLLLPNAGDDLQGMKKGIVEIADAFVINKVEAPSQAEAKRTQLSYRQALSLQHHGLTSWQVPVLACSSLEKTGFDEVQDMLTRFKSLAQEGAYWDSQRASQRESWFKKVLLRTLNERFLHEIQRQPLWEESLKKIQNGEISPKLASEALIALWRKA